MGVFFVLDEFRLLQFVLADNFCHAFCTLLIYMEFNSIFLTFICPNSKSEHLCVLKQGKREGGGELAWYRYSERAANLKD